MEQFCTNNDHWIDEYDHNHLRISRIIKSLNLLLDKEIAERFYNKIINRVNNSENEVSEDTILEWKESLNK